ncbi:chaperonin 10-like protein [Aspergillus ambiguus]|uniref:zinc-binding alcohol dehydrogenase family protein n=1 Tax=Aspergillus ambiguus TaxID=176160 RepID=UPI003CCD832C
MGLPSVQKAVVVTAPQEAKVVADRPLPALRENHILVKVVCVALNPADWKHIDFFPAPGALLGYDYSGIVEETGPGVTRFAKGDRICGLVHGGNAVQFEDGAFAEYIMAKEHVSIHIPENLSFQEAATIGVGITTVGLALHQSLKLKLPDDPIAPPVPILIYGGSSATGSLAIQVAKLSGYQVLTTCSPHNFDFVKRLGADVVCDYKDPGAASHIRSLTGDQLQIVFDTISIESSAQFCAEAISTEGGSYTSLLPVSAPRSDVQSSVVLGYTAFGAPFEFASQSFAAVPEDKAFAAWWLPLVAEMLASGKLKAHPLALREGGLDGVMDGLEHLRQDRVSGQKLVYNVSETS